MSDNPYADAAKISNPYSAEVEKQKNPYKYRAIQNRQLKRAQEFMSPLQADISQIQVPPKTDTGPISQIVDKSTEIMQKSGNTVLDMIEPLDRPRNALATGVKSAAQGEGFIEGAISGLSGDEYTSAQHLLTDEFRQEYPAISTIIGITGDIATDPLTYTPAAVIKAPVRLAYRT
jgi:hypothetical protein